MIERRGFLKLLGAMGAVIAAPLPAVAGAQTGGTFKIDARRLVVDLDKVGCFDYGGIRVLPWMDRPRFEINDKIMRPMQLDVTMYREDQWPDGFLDWLMSELKGPHDARLISKRLDIDRIATVETTTIKHPSLHDREMNDAITQVVMTTTIQPLPTPPPFGECNIAPTMEFTPAQLRSAQDIAKRFT